MSSEEVTDTPANSDPLPVDEAVDAVEEGNSDLPFFQSIKLKSNYLLFQLFK